MAHVNWLLAERFYVQGEIRNGRHHFPILAEVAEQFGCTLKTAQDRSSKDGWTEKRQRFTEQIRTQSAEYMAAHLGDRYGHTVISLLDSAYQGFEMMRLAAMKKITQPGPDGKLVIRDDVATVDLERASRTLERCAKQQKLILGLASDKVEGVLSTDEKAAEFLKRLAERRQALGKGE